MISIFVLFTIIYTKLNPTLEFVSRKFVSYNSDYRKLNNWHQQRYPSKQNTKLGTYRRQMSYCAVGCPSSCSPQCNPTCCLSGYNSRPTLQQQQQLPPPPPPPPTYIQPQVVASPETRYVAVPAVTRPENIRVVQKQPIRPTLTVLAPPVAQPKYRLVGVPDTPPLISIPQYDQVPLQPPQLSCGPSCNPSCISSGCSPSCCSAPPQPTPLVDVPLSHNMSPGQIASAGCSPVCANHWVATITGVTYTQKDSLTCPPKCASGCCQPPDAYVNLVKSCAPDCAPTYYPECCLGAATIPYQPPQPVEIQRTSFSPCSRMCAPQYNSDCCKRAAILPPLKK